MFPELARRLGGRDPIAPMIRMHEEIADLAGRFGALVSSLGEDQASDSELRELRRLYTGSRPCSPFTLRPKRTCSRKFRIAGRRMSAG